jgi:nucleoside-diphosphate-sugar epimerase
MTFSLFIFGMGYVGKKLAQSFNSKGRKIAGTSRQPLLNNGSLYSFNAQDKPDFSLLQKYSHLLITIPPNEEGDIVFRHYEKLFSQHSFDWIGYLSSTSVYGDHQGGWVTETSDLRATFSRGLQRIKAEQQWMSLFPKQPVHIFRLSGIYGPDRSVFEAIKMGKAQRIEKKGHYFSRIHVDDIVRVLETSMFSPTPGQIFNLADDLPAPSSDLIEFVCQTLGMMPPPLIPFEQAVLSEMGREFYLENKRVCNRKMKETLKITLKYPTYREGLTEILALSAS